MAIASQKIPDVFARNLQPPEVPLATVLDLWYLRHGSLLHTTRVVDIQDGAPRAEFLTRNYIRTLGYIRTHHAWAWGSAGDYTLDHGPYRLRMYHSTVDDTILSRLELKADNENPREQSVADTNATPG